MESWRSALLSGMSGLWEMWDSAPSQHSKRCPWLKGLSAGCGGVFPERAFSLCLGSCCCCCGVLLVAGVGGKAAVPAELNLPGGCGTGAADSSHTLHCWQHSSTAQSLPNLASAYKQGLSSGLAEVSWWFTRFPWALSSQICISQDLGLLSILTVSLEHPLLVLWEAARSQRGSSGCWVGL